MQKTKARNHRHEYKCACHQYNSKLPHKNAKEHSMRHYWPIRSKLTVIDGITMKGKRIIHPFLTQKQTLQQLHSNHMDMEKKRLLAHESV